MPKTFSALPLACLPLLACGSDSTHHINVVDSKTYEDSAMNCGAMASYTPSFGSAQQATDHVITGSNAGEALTWYGGLDMTAVLELDLFTGTTDFGGTTLTPKSGISLGGDNAHFESCGTCVLIDAAIDSQGHPQQTYLATAGTVNITSIKPSITGTMSNLSLVKVNIDSTSYVSTPVNDGCPPSTIASASFNIAVMTGSAAFTNPQFNDKILGHRRR
jgi:hypothetical protein